MKLKAINDDRTNYKSTMKNKRYKYLHLQMQSSKYYPINVPQFHPKVFMFDKIDIGVTHTIIPNFF